MDRVEFYSGEQACSPDVFVDPNDTSGQFVLNAGDLYSYNSQGRQSYTPYGYQQPFMNQPVQFGGYGYNPTYQNQQQFMGAPMNNPMVYPNQQGYQMGVQTMDPNQINTRFVGNPAFGLLDQWRQQGTPYQGPQQQGWYNPYTQQAFRPIQSQVVDRVVEVPGYNPLGSPGLLPADIKDICEKMDIDMMLELQESAAKMSKRAQGYYNANPYGWNYYGTPYVNYGYDQTITNKYMDKVKEISHQAIERKRELNKNLSRLVHKFLNDGVTEEDINRIYDGYSYTIPASSIQEYQTQERLYNTVPFDNSEMYRQASAQVTREYQAIAPPGHNMAEFFEDAGMFFIVENLKQEQHRRRDTKQYYDSNIYSSYLRKYALEHDIQARDQQHTKEVAEKLADLALEKGDKVTKGDIMNVLYTPQQIASLREQGFIIHPDGSAELKVPDHILNNHSEPPAQVINAENELDYEMRRSAFIASIYNNNRSQVGG